MGLVVETLLWCGGVGGCGFLGRIYGWLWCGWGYYFIGVRRGIGWLHDMENTWWAGRGAAFNSSPTPARKFDALGSIVDSAESVPVKNDPGNNRWMVGLRVQGLLNRMWKVLPGQCWVTNCRIRSIVAIPPELLPFRSSFHLLYAQ